MVENRHTSETSVCELKLTGDGMSMERSFSDRPARSQCASWKGKISESGMQLRSVSTILSLSTNQSPCSRFELYRGTTAACLNMYCSNSTACSRTCRVWPVRSVHLPRLPVLNSHRARVPACARVCIREISGRKKRATCVDRALPVLTGGAGVCIMRREEVQVLRCDTRCVMRRFPVG